MSEQEKKALVPALRFPEFRGAWKEEELGNVARSTTGESNREDSLSEGKYAFFDRSDEIRASSRYLFDAEAIIVAGEGQEFIPKYFVGKFDLHQRAYATVDFKENIVGKYIFYWMHYARSYFNKVAVGSTVPSLRLPMFTSFPVAIPRNKKEQQKIAHCLSSLDELISLQTQKRDALKAHKKGLMQQLFPAIGETQPKQRFPEFRGKGEWEEKLFGKILKVNSGKGFKASEYSDAGIRLLQIENVGYSVTKWGENTIYLPERYAFEYPELVLQKGDIVLALNRPVTNNELKIARIQKDDEPLILYQRVGKLVLLNNSLNENFVFQICQKFIKDFVVNKSIGSDQPFISLRDLYAQLIRIPKPEEQQKIADCLSSLDELITAQTQKIDALKSHKKGLMQQLFPAMDEVDA